MKDKELRTTMVLYIATRDRLKAIGKKGESYDLLINKLLDHYHNFTIDGNSRRKGEWVQKRK